MRTLALRDGARVTVVAAEWCDAYGIVTRGRVQLELRDGEPGPVLGRDAGFWFRGTGVRPAEIRPSHGEGAHRHPPGPRPSHASHHAAHASNRMTEERHEQR